MALISEKRKLFHNQLLKRLITKDKDDIVSIADSSSVSSKTIASDALKQIGIVPKSKKIAGQKAGKIFENLCLDFLVDTFLNLQELRPGMFHVHKGSEISNFTQYQHLHKLSEMASQTPDLATTIGQDYLITPDIIVSRSPEFDLNINRLKEIVDKHSAKLTPLRHSNSENKLLHATISCKYTIRSDRVQNARSEALNVIRNRKGNVPHISVITSEPLPSRLASIALGTGDIDCVYHAFLPELLNAVNNVGSDDSAKMLDTLVEGNRLRDISDLPLDLAI